MTKKQFSPSLDPMSLGSLTNSPISIFELRRNGFRFWKAQIAGGDVELCQQKTQISCLSIVTPLTVCGITSTQAINLTTIGRTSVRTTYHSIIIPPTYEKLLICI